MRHEEKHALGMWLVAALLGGFALLSWWVGTLERDTRRPLPRPPVEVGDSAAA